MLLERILRSKALNFFLLKYKLCWRFILVLSFKIFFISSKRFFFWKTDSYSDSYWFKFSTRVESHSILQLF
jgi:hypothetical protein